MDDEQTAGPMSDDASEEVDAEVEAEIEEIEAERERRLDPANRPENSIVDNSDADLPTVRHFEELNAEDSDSDSGDEDEDGAPAGSSDPSQRFRDLEYSEDEKEEMARERERRLDPDNRPDNVEIDNTGRAFEDGHFVDGETDGEDDDED